MALCHNCDNARDQYIGNGVQKEYEITFEYYKQDDVAVAFWNAETLVWEPVSDSKWTFQHETLIRFEEAPEYGQEFIIYRCTDLEPLPAEFYPGTAIKAQDLNDNFFVLKTAIEEARCAISRNDDKSEEKYWDKVEDTIIREQQITGEAEPLLDDEHIFTAAASVARHDSYVQDSRPASLPYEQPGKVWHDTDAFLDYFWDDNVNTWVSFNKSGTNGPPGEAGPPGKVIVGDTPPTSYPQSGSNEARDLESGDLWFDSFNVIMYIWYEDYTGGQWVATAIPGPPGPPGPPGEDGIELDGLTAQAPIVITKDTANNAADFFLNLTILDPVLN